MEIVFLRLDGRFEWVSGLSLDNPLYKDAKNFIKLRIVEWIVVKQSTYYIGCYIIWYTILLVMYYY